ncbi:DUF2332 domain-containing protein [Nitratireductor kimnyeongensis]|uniref:DUF2332 domain-containing protein n=1 Tax=Nitratireductor kimnyeongensis TaxID=430679 RepID=A0ABW0TBI9_9HYPH|nr:DUF2332 family protein [Nitratireductor kimnyeongensis]QZZ36991.1 DUF2332 family protein [Nitratireductor kimnyeongensis]
MTTRISAHFEKQAQACDCMGSPFTAQLCRLLSGTLDRETDTGARVLGWPGEPGEDALALRLCGGLHALVLAGADAPLAGVYPPNAASPEALQEAVSAAIAHHDERLCANLDSAPQTNEIGRSAMLMPGFLTIARETGLPLDLFEIGSSAGLNLLFDRFHYRYGDGVWGKAASPVSLAPEMRGSPPDLSGVLDVTTRRGSDIAPIDVSRDDQRLRLTSYVWADQEARLSRLRAAIELANETPFALEKADAADFVDALLVARRPDRVTVLFHSIMWQYLRQETRARIETALETAGRAGGAPIAWLRMEPSDTKEPFALVSLTLWPTGKRRDLARCDFHGRWIEWLL